MNLTRILSVSVPWDPRRGFDPKRPETKTSLVRVYLDPVALAIYLALRVNEKKLSRDNGLTDPFAARRAALNLASQLRFDPAILWRRTEDSGPGVPTWPEALAREVAAQGVFPGGTVPDGLKYLADLIHPHLCGRPFEYVVHMRDGTDRRVAVPCQVDWKEFQLTQYVFREDGTVFDLKGNVVGHVPAEWRAGKAVVR